MYKEIKHNSLVLLSVEEHVVIGCNHQTDVCQKAIAATVHKLKDILVSEYRHYTIHVTGIQKKKNEIYA